MIGERNDIRDREEGESYVEYFLDHVDLQEQTESTYRVSWNRLAEFAERKEYPIEKIGEERAREFCDELKQDDDLKEKIAERYVNRISLVVDWLIENGKADYNPYSPFLPSARTRSNGYFDYDTESSTEKLEVPLNELRDAIQSISRPELLVYVVLLVKTGIRMSEALNIDYEDIHLDHPIADRMPQPRREILNKPDTLYIDSSINQGEEYRGEKRERGNKPDSSRAIPIDQELKDTLVWWIAMTTPSSSGTNPLFTVTSNRHGERLHSSTLRDLLREWAVEHEFHGENMAHFGVSAHWFRHWLSTILRSRISEDEVIMGSVKDYVAGLRGDSDNSTIATYTQEWDQIKKDGDKTYRQVYEDNIPQLFVNTEDQEQ